MYRRNNEIAGSSFISISSAKYKLFFLLDETEFLFIVTFLGTELSALVNLLVQAE